MEQEPITAVAPAAVKTPALERWVPKDEIDTNVGTFAPLHPLGRVAADVANAVTYLLSDQTSWVTGATLNVDGRIMAGRNQPDGGPGLAGNRPGTLCALDNQPRTQPWNTRVTRTQLWRRSHEEMQIAGEPLMSPTSYGLAWIYDEHRITTYLLPQMRGQRNPRLLSDMPPESSVH
jgi:hypothetical protein